ncbi:magnesium-translocating P-type ATPase [Pseudopedobacter saltans DSM 12145]|uniref:Magnesium-transporting ATPase, P-type 1 n=1 Tax=Pseudopedobacter saltans (strain ATCC 51119 / DSM 12145 / JCM 21818 / CCUG 39354 / LMG 10337 / NBRC 100064 / NCIMB 13643) TaxID=762903 RepID=F0S7E6_PSESL|nr:magnesium-translocating P-type ATPase [Pseudopedobacter saltans]ADY51171.1 magnesium-translocating P-type ATPase [Pseudopedobacter saltans DSM 12145]
MSKGDVSKSNIRLEYPWTKGSEYLFNTLDSGNQGISAASAKERLVQYGPNSLKGKNVSSAYLLFLGQFKSPITLILIAAAILSFLLQDRTDAIIILLIVMISSCLGFWQEYGASNAIARLLKLVQVTVAVLREGKEETLGTEAIVPGDIVILSAGDIIPADCVILSSQDLFVDEAAFTGESYPVEKQAGILAEDAPVAKRSNMLFMGSHVISGKAKVIVVSTGMATEFGKISDRLRQNAPETEFEKGIKKFGFMLMQITLVLILVIFALNVFLHKPVLDSFLFSLALAVGLTPQLLPVIITVNLSSGAKKMAAQQVIVKRLAAIENFGSMNILCSDKTGTITQGKVRLYKTFDMEDKGSDLVNRYALFNASLQQGFKNPIDEAIIEAFKADITDLPKALDEIPYDFVRKRLSIVVSLNDKSIVVTKGAFQEVLNICTQVQADKDKILPLSEGKKTSLVDLYERYSKEGYRTLGICWKQVDAPIISREQENDMVFLGFLTFFDPPKESAITAIRNLEKLGVKLKIITGDNALVAESLAKQVGIENPVVVKGGAIRNISTEALSAKVHQADIFAEVEPNQKEQIILALKKSKQVVGFMGDGINDAAALHAADVGISVDTAVDVAKEAADLVLMDQDLEVLANGIKEGRRTFANTMKYIFMATSANFGNMFSMAGASLLLPFLPLLPKQILLTNLLTDIPETTIATDNVDEEYINTPHRIDIGFIKKFMLVFGLLSSVFDYCTFGVLILVLKANEQQFQTGWFLESVVSAALIVLVVRTRLPFFKSTPGKPLLISNVLVILFVLILPLTALGNLFGFVNLPLKFYVYMFVIILAYVLTADYMKRWFYRKLATGY